MKPRIALAALAVALAGCGAPAALAPSPAASAAASAAAPAALAAPLTEVAAYRAAADAYVVLDARPAAAYALEHAGVARNAPLADLAAIAPALPRDKRLLVYCTCDDEGLALQVAGKLKADHGFTQVEVLKGGLAAWKAAGLAVEGTAVAK